MIKLHSCKLKMKFVKSNTYLGISIAWTFENYKFKKILTIRVWNKSYIFKREYDAYW